MGIYLKDMEMPTGNHEIIVRIQSDGRVLDQWGHRFNQEFIAVPVPQHGDLIERDKAVRDLRMDYAYAAARIVSLQPIIVPAEEEPAKGINVPTKKEEAMNYKKLIDSLRICGDSVDAIDECSFEECILHERPIDPLCMKALCHKAADAIEELRRREKFHAFIWKTLGFGYMRKLEELYQEEEESDV